MAFDNFTFPLYTIAACFSLLFSFLFFLSSLIIKTILWIGFFLYKNIKFDRMWSTQKRKKLSKTISGQFIKASTHMCMRKIVFNFELKWQSTKEKNKQIIDDSRHIITRSPLYLWINDLMTWMMVLALLTH